MTELNRRFLLERQGLPLAECAPKTRKPPILIGGSKTARSLIPRYMNVPSPAPCHTKVAGVGKQSVWGLRIIARSLLSLWHDFVDPSIPKSGGRAGSQTRICSFGRCRVVRLHYPPSGTRAGNPTRISSLGSKRHRALDHASPLNVEGMQRIEL
jgi:hypothetical protein